MPVNLRTHGHGQGYTDLNFVIPELVDRVNYFKGPYYANVGDFGSAGGADMIYTEGLKQGIALGTLGSFDYRRALLAASPTVGPGTLTYGLEYFHNDGPWDVPDNYRKLNGFLRYVVPLGESRLGITAMAYDGRWIATDQIPQRAVDQGLIGRASKPSTTAPAASRSVTASPPTSRRRWPMAFNMFDTKSSDITYFYESRLQGEPDEGVADRHFHPNERRSYPVSLSYQF